jgi:hypothetical protein
MISVARGGIARDLNIAYMLQTSNTQISCTIFFFCNFICCPFHAKNAMVNYFFQVKVGELLYHLRRRSISTSRAEADTIT